jgi:hypothetical protein
MTQINRDGHISRQVYARNCFEARKGGVQQGLSEWRGREITRIEAPSPVDQEAVIQEKAACTVSVNRRRQLQGTLINGDQIFEFKYEGNFEDFCEKVRDIKKVVPGKRGEKLAALVLATFCELLRPPESSAHLSDQLVERHGNDNVKG